MSKIKDYMIDVIETASELFSAEDDDYVDQVSQHLLRTDSELFSGDEILVEEIVISTLGLNAQ